jgi:retron-type reverse transcriptase
LGIPTLQDRALQAVVKVALEPQWEARFEPNSYGFRPGRSTWDAIGAIYVLINQKAKWMLDADIAKCFDRINHDALLKKLNPSPLLRRQVRAWLQAGGMDKGEWFPTETGSPQGGGRTPLTQRKRLIDGQDMADGNFVGVGVHHDLLNQEPNNLVAFRKVQGREVGVHPVGKQGKLLNPL